MESTRQKCGIQNLTQDERDSAFLFHVLYIIHAKHMKFGSRNSQATQLLKPTTIKWS